MRLFRSFRDAQNTEKTNVIRKEYTKKNIKRTPYSICILYSPLAVKCEVKPSELSSEPLSEERLKTETPTTFSSKLKIKHQDIVICELIRRNFIGYGEHLIL